LIIYAVMFVTWLLFVTEFTLMTWCKADYRFSFFWGLDFLAMASLIPGMPKEPYESALYKARRLRRAL
jgi:hypothetical protein